MSTLKQDILKRVINPQEFIQQAEQQAKEATDLLDEKQSQERKSSFELKDDDPLDKKADSVLAAIDLCLDDKSPVEKPEEKRAEPKGKKANEKTAVANLISMGMDDDAIRKEIENGEYRTSFSIANFNRLNIDALNEKIAFNLAKLKKPLLMTLGAGVAGTAGYAGGRRKGRKELRRYVAADRQRDVITNRRAFLYGQQSVVNKLRRAFAARGGKSE